MQEVNIRFWNIQEKTSAISEEVTMLAAPKVINFTNSWPRQAMMFTTTVDLMDITSGLKHMFFITYTL